MKEVIVSLTREDAFKKVGEGWKSLINELYDFLEVTEGTPKVLDIKRRWGVIRIYTDVMHNTVDSFIESLGTKSLTICEQCGKEAKIYLGPTFNSFAKKCIGTNPQHQCIVEYYTDSDESTTRENWLNSF